MLHLIFQSSVDCAILDRMATGDAAVFMESAVLAILQQGQLSDALRSKLGSNQFYVLANDMAVRGIQEAEIIKGIEVINYSGLVKLTVEHSLIQSWC